MTQRRKEIIIGPAHFSTVGAGQVREDPSRFDKPGCKHLYIGARKPLLQVKNKEILVSLLEVGGQHFDGACELVLSDDFDLNVVFGQQFAHPIRPFDDADAISVQILL